MIQDAEINRVTAALARAWALRPDPNLGTLLEQVENIAWDLYPMRTCSARLMNLDNGAFEAALNMWITKHTPKS